MEGFDVPVHNYSRLIAQFGKEFLRTSFCQIENARLRLLRNTLISIGSLVSHANEIAPCNAQSHKSWCKNAAKISARTRSPSPSANPANERLELRDPLCLFHRLTH